MCIRDSLSGDFQVEDIPISTAAWAKAMKLNFQQIVAPVIALALFGFGGPAVAQGVGLPGQSGESQSK